MIQKSSFLKFQIPEIKLLKITLPVFSNNLEEWLSFYNLFKANVDCIENLSESKN